MLRSQPWPLDFRNKDFNHLDKAEIGDVGQHMIFLSKRHAQNPEGYSG